MIKVNVKKCIGCGLCASICPAIFEIKDNKARVKCQKEDKCVDEAVSSCPVQAITK